MFTTTLPEFKGSPSHRPPKTFFESISIPAVKVSDTSIEVPDTAVTRVIVAALTDIEEFNDYESFRRIQTKFNEKYPEDVKHLEPPLRGPGLTPMAAAIHPYIQKLAELDYHERLARARDNKALAEREGELAGLFGGKKRRKTHKRAKKSKKHGRRRGTRRH